MTPLFQFTVLLAGDERRSTQVLCNKNQDEVVNLIKTHTAKDTGLSVEEVMILAWLFDCLVAENCACSHCFNEWLEEDNLNETVMAAAMLRLVKAGWVDAIKPPDKEAAN